MNISRSSRSGAAFTLIELLVVISIIAILASLAFTSAQSAMLAAKRVQAKNDMIQIAGAVQSYYTEYGRYPIASSVTIDVSYYNTNDQIISVLRYKTSPNMPQASLDALNQRQIKFLEPKVVAFTKACVNTTSGIWYDPWGAPFMIFIDGDYSGDITATSLGFATNPQVGVGVASVGYYFVKNKMPLTSTPSTTYDKTYLLSWQ